MIINFLDPLLFHAFWGHTFVCPWLTRLIMTCDRPGWLYTLWVFSAILYSIYPLYCLQQVLFIKHDIFICKERKKIHYYFFADFLLLYVRPFIDCHYYDIIALILASNYISIDLWCMCLYVSFDTIFIRIDFIFRFC